MYEGFWVLFRNEFARMLGYGGVPTFGKFGLERRYNFPKVMYEGFGFSSDMSSRVSWVIVDTQLSKS